MTYAVVWSIYAIQEVAHVESASSDPQAVRAAAARIDHTLRRYPREMGESRWPGYREWYEDVLGVVYRIDEEKMRVEVLSAGPTKRH